MYFSNAMATSQNRTAFVATVLDLVEKYDVDGIEFEYVKCHNPFCGGFALLSVDKRVPFLIVLAVGNTPENKESGVTPSRHRTRKISSHSCKNCDKILKERS